MERLATKYLLFYENVAAFVSKNSEISSLRVGIFFLISENKSY